MPVGMNISQTLPSSILHSITFYCRFGCGTNGSNMEEEFVNPFAFILESYWLNCRSLEYPLDSAQPATFTLRGIGIVVRSNQDNMPHVANVTSRPEISVTWNGTWKKINARGDVGRALCRLIIGRKVGITFVALFLTQDTSAGVAACIFRAAWID